MIYFTSDTIRADAAFPQNDNVVFLVTGRTASFCQIWGRLHIWIKLDNFLISSDKIFTHFGEHSLVTNFVTRNQAIITHVIGLVMK